MGKLRLLFAAILLCFLPLTANAQGPSLTTVNGTFYSSNGQPANGTITISTPIAFLSADGYPVPSRVNTTVPITNGAFSVQLVPTVASTPGGAYYIAGYNFAGGSYSEYWVVPYSATPVGILQVRAAVPPLPTISIPIAQLTPPINCISLGGLIQWTSSGWTCNPGASGIASVTWSLPAFMSATPSTISSSGTQTFSFTDESQNYFLAGPCTGGAGPVGFRAICVGDVPTLNQSTTGNAGTATDLSTTGSNGTFWGVSGGVQGWYTPAGSGNFTVSGGAQYYITDFTTSTTGSGIAPSSASYALVSNGLTSYPSFQYLPVGSVGSSGLSGSAPISVAATGAISCPACNTSNATVSTFSAGTLSPLFTTSVATATTTPALSFTLSNAGAYTVFGNPGGTSTSPSFTANPAVSSIVLEGSSSGSFTLSATATGSGLNLGSNASLTSGGALTVAGLTDSAMSGGPYCVQETSGVLSSTGAACGSGSGAVNSVTNSDGTLTISPTTGSVVASLALGHVNTWTAAQTFPDIVLAGSASYAPTVAGTLGYDTTNNRYVGGNGTSTSYFTWILAAPTSGHLATWSGTLGQLTDGGAVPTGTVTSFSAGNLSPLFTTSVATATTTPALTFSLSSAAQNSVFAGPASGGAGAPSFQTAPTISAANMTNFPTFNQNTTGTAANITGQLPLSQLNGGSAPSGQSYDFTGVTLLKARVSAGLTTSANGDFGYDTTNKNWHGYNNGADLLFPEVPTGTPVNGDCADWVVSSSNVRLGDAGAACGSGGSGTVNSASQYSFAYYPNSGSAAVVGGVPAPTTNGLYYAAYNVTGSAAVAPAALQVGLGGRALTGSASTDTVAYSDVATVIDHDVGGSASVNETLPTATTLLNSAFAYSYANHSSHTDTITPTTWTIQSGNSAAASTLSVGAGVTCRIKVDPNSSTNWLADCNNAGSGGTPGGSSTDVQYNNGGSFGGISDWTTNGTTTLTGAASSILNLNAGTLELPSSASYAPTTASYFGYDSTNGRLVFGNGSSAIVPWITTAPTSGHLATWSGALGQLADGGAVPVGVPSGTLGEYLVNNNGSTGYQTTPAHLDCSVFSGSDWTVQVANCLAALYALNSTSGIADARGVAAGTGTVNPFTSASNLPASGVLLLGPGTYITAVPIVPPNDWSIQGLTPRAVAGSIGTTIQASSTFPTYNGAYTTGTITVGTAGANEVITGSSTSWATPTIEPGCAFVAPAGGGSNDTFGIIKTVTSGTSITLYWGANNGTGASGGSSYDIYCPVVAQGGGGSSAAGAMFGMALQNIGIDADNLNAAVTGVMNWYGQQDTYLRNVEIRNFNGIGYDKEYQAQNSGSDDNVLLSPGAGCSTSTLPVTIRLTSEASKPFENFSTSKGSCSTLPAVGVDVQTSNIVISGGDTESTTVGISVGANISCPVACPMPTHLPADVRISNAANQSSSGTTLVHLSNALGTLQDITLENLAYSGITNILVDDANSCTSTNTHLGNYWVNHAGTIGASTDPTSGCAAPAGGVTSVSNSDGTLTISPTTGAVVASLALGHANTWTGVQTLDSPIFVTPALGTPASGVLTNATGLPLTTGVTGVLPSANGGTGVNNSATLTLGTSNQNWATLGTGIVKNTTTTGALSNAASSDVISLWTGSCSSSTYLNGAGACATPGGSGIINAASQYDVPYYSASGSATTLSGAAISGFQYDSTSGAPAAATAANLGSLIDIAQYDVLVSGGTSAAPVGVAVGAGQVLEGASSANPSGTATPTLGTDGSIAGTLQMANSSASFHTIIGSAATANNTFLFPAAVFTNGHMGYCATSTTICTWTDAGYAYNAIPNGDISGLGALATAGYPSAGVVYSNGSAFSAATAAQIGTVFNIAQYAQIYSNGTSAAPLGLAAPTTNADWFTGYHITGSAASAPVNEELVASTTNSIGITITPTYNATGPTQRFEATGTYSGSISSSQVTTGLGYTPANCTAGTTGSDCLQLSSGLVPSANLPGGLAIANTTFTNPTTAVSANSCSASASTVTMTGVTSSMVVLISPSADVSGGTGWGSSGGLVIDAWFTTNTLNYKICNQTSSSITPTAETWNVSAR